MDPIAPAESPPQTTTVQEPTRRSPWSLRAKIGRVLWSTVAVTLWRWSPRPWNGLRRTLLRLFGATIGRRVAIDPTVRVEIPWNLTIEDDVRVCDGAILYSLGTISIGRGTLIGPFVHICAGTHDYSSPSFWLLRTPIVIESECVILAAAFVAPDVTVRERCVLRERCGVYADTEPGQVYEGNPARATGPREEHAS
jgi:putative colanic acid biosynthesis acetyltransferase WcaF